MAEPESPRISHHRRHCGHRFMVLCAAVMMLFVQSGCDEFFGMEGHLYQCETKVPIADADGSADEEKFTTDSLGFFSFALNAPDSATVRVSLLKEGFVPFFQEFKGEPAESENMEFCMDPVARP